MKFDHINSKLSIFQLQITKDIGMNICIQISQEYFLIEYVLQVLLKKNIHEIKKTKIKKQFSRKINK
jgi:hypothetical protein